MQRLKVSEVCKAIIDCVNRTAPVVDYPTPFRMIRTTNVRNGRVDLSNAKYVDEDTFHTWTRRGAVEEGDTILTREAPIGEVGHIKGLGKVFLGQRLVQYKPDPEKIDPRFLYFAFRSPDLQAQFGAFDGSGSVVSHIRVGDCHNFQIDVPDMDTQKKIAGVLGNIDDKIELNRQMNETLEALARALFQDWFVDFGPTRRKQAGETDPLKILGGAFPDPTKAAEIAVLFPSEMGDDDLPEGWSPIPLDEVANFLNGLALQKYPPRNDGKDLPVLKIAELRSGITAKTNMANSDVADKFIIKPGDFVFSWSGSLMAKFWDGADVALNQHLFKVTSKRFPEWFYSQWVWHHLEEFQAIAASKAVTMGHIKRSHLQEAMCADPGSSLVEKLSDTLGSLAEIQMQNALENQTLAQTRDLLLPKLMSGEIRLKDSKKIR